MFLAIRPTKVVQHLKNINNKKYFDTNHKQNTLIYTIN